MPTSSTACWRRWPNPTPVLLYLLTSAFMALETSLLLGLLVPGDSLLLAGTTVTALSRFAAQVTASTLGSLLGEPIGYLLGRHYGRRCATARLGRRLRPDAWAKTEHFLSGRGGPAVAAARIVAVVMRWFPLSRARHEAFTDSRAAEGIEIRARLGSRRHIVH